jgi:hypothetical protein
MAPSEDIADLGALLLQLRKKDKKLRVFGSEAHTYHLGLILSEDMLKRFESAHGIRLPPDYRRFLAEVGNGGAGPCYGLDRLTTPSRDLSRPFPLTKATEELSEEELTDLGDPDDYPGILELCHQGCGVYYYLVVNGPTYGTIWEGMEDFSPTGLTFSSWYRSWLEHALLTLANEHLVARLRVGMSKTEVVANVASSWQERKALHRPISFFEAPDIPAQLELDEHGIVVKINPWPFIAARPMY